MEIPIHPKCSKCESESEKLKEFLENRPWKYGSRATIEIKQDYLGDGWHLDNVTFDNCEAEGLREEHAKAVSEGREYDLQSLLNNLSWGGWFDDILKDGGKEELLASKISEREE